MSSFKKYRNKESGKEVEGSLMKWFGGAYKFRIKNGYSEIFLTKRHFKLNWEEIEDEANK